MFPPHKGPKFPETLIQNTTHPRQISLLIKENFRTEEIPSYICPSIQSPLMGTNRASQPRWSNDADDVKNSGNAPHLIGL